MIPMNISLIIIAILVIIYILFSIRKNRLNPATSFIWIIFCTVLLILSIWPSSLDWLATFLGISYPPALFFAIAIVALFVINFTQSQKIADLHEKVIDLAQEISILKHDQNRQKKQKKQNQNEK